MLTGQGLIGKFVDLLATKLIGKKIDLALDDRKRACRAFVELYYCVERLEDISDHFLEELKDIRESGNGWMVVNSLALHGSSISSLSQRFLDIGAELDRVVELYDPDLARAIGQLYGFKYSFLLFIADSIHIEEKEGQRNRLLKYREPSPKVLSIDMESYYQWVKETGDKKITDSERLEWPANMLAWSAFKEGFEEVVIEVADVEAVGKFRKVLVDHGAVLTSAREKLRKLIIENFNLDEVLFVSKRIPHAE